MINPAISPMTDVISDELSLVSPVSVTSSVLTSTGVLVASNSASKSGICVLAMTSARLTDSIFWRNCDAISFFSSMGT
mgnify:CR=1 FL=1